MIKRLVKYGNSQAIVLDKALLEILNISDATQLKLSTDGKSLTITPLVEESVNKPTKPSVSIAESEAEMHYSALQAKAMDPVLRKIVENPEAFQTSQAGFKTLMDEFNAKYNYSQRMMETTKNPLYKEASKKLTEQAYAEGWSQEVYAKKQSDLMQTFVPEIPLKEFHESWKKLEKEYESNLKKEQPHSREAAMEPQKLSKLEIQQKDAMHKAFKSMQENPEEWQQMQWEMKQFMDAFDAKYNYNQRCMELMHNPLYKEATETLKQQAIEENWDPSVSAQKSMELMQSFMPEVPLDELRESSKKIGEKYAKLNWEW